MVGTTVEVDGDVRVPVLRVDAGDEPLADVPVDLKRG